MSELIDGFLDIVIKFKEMLILAKALVEMNNDMMADGGDPFDVPWEVRGKDNDSDVIPLPDNEGLKEGENGLAEEVSRDQPELGEFKERIHGVRRARVTKEIREQIIGALLNRVPRPRMVDIASEFDVSQTTVSRIWGAYQAEYESAAQKVVGLSKTNAENCQHVPLPGQMNLPVLSEGRKPGPED